jgi:glycosyltransferase involved in cell wall biosynthesis
MKYNFCIVTYETLSNPITQNLKTYLLENYCTDLLYIYHPQLKHKEGYQITSGYYFFKDNKLNQSGKAPYLKLFSPLFYVKDIFYTLFWCIKVRRKFDIYFACGNLNPVAGIILKNFGIVRKVVYQSIDYYPKRFENIFFNWLYFQLDKFCVKFADETWNASSVIVQARNKRMGMDPNVFNRQYTVPSCIWFYKAKRLPLSKINRKKIVYRGMLYDYMGVDLIIKAMPRILKKIPGVKFEIIGDGKEREYLEKLAKDLGISKNVIFHGLITDRGRLEKILSDSALGVATFNTNKLDEKIKNADPGKLKDYMLMGMPVITTEAISYRKKFIESKCGIIVQYNVASVVNAVVKLLTNKKLQKEYRENVLKFILPFDCSNILKPNIERVLSQ